ncbi:hypothetical protein HanXRQr2_Chr05g0227631 [Helianthus annuus]|uniref:Uncharacterized protein n=1 Tax=Helianthus annuus TaxID=4232 RepID=A0A9K3NNL2_HELAN|nr:hypothetical protein HanXRQr2_Chr05g0227631 [Helianthus annuus]KAJ0923747.1 hypothetical protein HanPSC8_Chr05g0219671 [Helianthus annuus]
MKIVKFGFVMQHMYQLEPIMDRNIIHVMKQGNNYPFITNNKHFFLHINSIQL